MTKREIIFIPAPILRQVAAPVEAITAEIKQLASDMLETMYAAPGIGLAAPQINVPLRLFVMDAALRADEEAGKQADEAGEDAGQATGEPLQEEDLRARPLEPNPIVMINPEIVQFSDDRAIYEEGCLSIPDYFADVERPASVTVSYLDLDGKKNERHFVGVESVVVQHEYDHLDGKLFIDYLSKLRRDRVIKKFTKMQKSQKPKL